MFIETLEFTIPVELCNIFSSLQKGPASNVEFPASVNSYGTTQDASVQVVLRSNKLTFKVDGVSSNASMISKSECKTLKLSVFDVDRTLMPQENDNDNYNANNMSTVQTLQQTVYLSNPAKRLHESSVSMPQPASKSSRTSFSESPRPRSPVHAIHRRPHSQASASPSNHSQQSKSKNDSQVNVKQEPEDPDLIEIEPDPEPNNIVPKKETPYMQIDYSSDVPHTQTSQAALERLSHPQSSHSQSPGSSSSSFHQNVPHVPDYAEPSTSQARYGDQSADDFLVFQDENDDGDDNEADYSNDGFGSSVGEIGPGFAIRSKTLHTEEYRQSHGAEGGSGSRQSERKDVWICEECGKQFSKSSNRNTHYKTVHGNASYICVCGKAYRYPQGLNKHKRCCIVLQQLAGQGQCNPGPF
ncbi:C2H2 finger domain transcription factor mtfA-like isoform X20 [Haliotis rufescens]|uniref:C2H2 finger domain transcription factor mtfA-like isoform X20 n=1 Tax=Haliotis rufescens TaxID=6454 RepID=UPI001EB09D89|nr:C2H2 finger domain transcription factor mtfA-like isoform X20 [Haliotis rufescens]